MKVKIKRDTFRASRGGNTKILTIICAACNNPLFNYQKDGAGQLIRCYLDRIISENPHQIEQNTLRCNHCKALIGNLIIYKPEKRLAYVLVRGAIKKEKSN